MAANSDEADFDVPLQPVTPALAIQVERVLSNGLASAYDKIVGAAHSVAPPLDRSRPHQISRPTTDALIEVWREFDCPVARELVMLAFTANVFAAAVKVEDRPERRGDVIEAIDQRLRDDLTSHIEAARTSPGLLETWPLRARVTKVLGWAMGDAQKARAREARRLAHHPHVLLSERLDDEGAATVGDSLIEGDFTHEIEHTAMVVGLAGLMERADLSAEMCRVLDLAFGLSDGQEPLTDEQVAAEMGYPNRLKALRVRTRALDEIRKQAVREEW